MVWQQVVIVLASGRMALVWSLCCSKPNCPCFEFMHMYSLFMRMSVAAIDDSLKTAGMKENDSCGYSMQLSANLNLFRKTENPLDRELGKSYLLVYVVETRHCACRLWAVQAQKGISRCTQARAHLSEQHSWARNHVQCRRCQGNKHAVFFLWRKLCWRPWLEMQQDKLVDDVALSRDMRSCSSCQGDQVS